MRSKRNNFSYSDSESAVTVANNLNGATSSKSSSHSESAGRPRPRPVTASNTTTKGQKRKSDIAVLAASGDEEQPVARAKKGKKNPSAESFNPSQRPTPRPSVSRVAQETIQDQAVPRKRPAEVDDVDEDRLMTPVRVGPPSKKPKANALRHTGLFFHV